MKADGSEHTALSGGKYGKAITTVVLATAFVFLMILLGPVQDTGDDAMMAWQLVQGEGSLASFISPFLSLAMIWLYQHVPQIPWWSLVHVVSAWVLLIVLSRVAEQKYWQRHRMFLYPMLFVAVWLVVMRRVNFTRTAGAFSLAGLTLCLECVFEKRDAQRFYWGKLLVGVLLFTAGLMVRFNGALLALPYAGVILLLRVREIRCNGGFRAALGVCLVIALVTSILPGAEAMYWDRHPDWKAYREYSDARAAIVDYAQYYPSWEEAQEFYKTAGLNDENDLRILLDKAYIGDPDVFTLETLQKIGSIRGRSMGAWMQFKRAAATALNVLREGKVLLWLFLWLGYLLCRREKCVCIHTALMLGVSCCILTWFSFSGKMVPRIWEPVLLCAFAMGLVCRDTEAVPEEDQRWGGNRKKAVFAGLAVVLGVYSGLIQGVLGIHLPNAKDDRDEVTRARAEYIQSTQDRIYLLSQPLFHHPPTPSPFGLWEAIPQGYLQNYFALSNWEMNTPTNLAKLSALGISNPTRALIDRDDTYSEFMDQRMFLFLKSHYGANITCSFVDVFPDGGAVVQYAAPTAGEIAKPKEPADISLLKWEADDRWQIKVWHVEGTVTDWPEGDACTAWFCNVVMPDGQVYSFRLAYEEAGHFSSFFYDIDAQWLAQATEISLVGKTAQGELVSAGVLPV